jgi:hypothetical protein
VEEEASLGLTGKGGLLLGAARLVGHDVADGQAAVAARREQGEVAHEVQRLVPRLREAGGERRSRSEIALGLRQRESFAGALGPTVRSSCGKSEGESPSSHRLVRPLAEDAAHRAVEVLVAVRQERAVERRAREQGMVCGIRYCPRAILQVSSGGNMLLPGRTGRFQQRSHSPPKNQKGTPLNEPSKSQGFGGKNSRSILLRY